MTCPLPRYWLCHALVAQIVMWVSAPLIGIAGGAVAGAAFYIGREVRDREKLGTWDWPGLISPVAANALALAAVLYLRN